jgi:hypothetical protein
MSSYRKDERCLSDRAFDLPEDDCGLLDHDIVMLEDEGGLSNRYIVLLKDDFSLVDHDIVVVEDEGIPSNEDIVLLKDDFSLVDHDIVVVEDEGGLSNRGAGFTCSRAPRDKPKHCLEGRAIVTNLQNLLAACRL